MNITTDKIRTPCCAVLGHVDVGKTKLLDYMRRSETEEASGITQQIGTTLYNRSRLETLVGSNLKNKFALDSILMIDTPGHECFDIIRYVALRVADVVILMVDMIKGLEKQTIDVISHLIRFNVPFIICLNKMDRIFNWCVPKHDDKLNISSVLKRMTPDIVSSYNDYVKKIKYKLYEHEVNSELYYQNKSPDNIVSIVPISAKTGEGIPDLIMLISTMAEKRYLSDKMIDSNICHGYILDSHYDKIHGNYQVALHRNGTLKKGDCVLIGTADCKVRYKVKYILLNASDNKEIKDDHRFLRSDMIDRSVGFGIILEPENPGNNCEIKPASTYVLEKDILDGKISQQYIDDNSKTSSENEYEKRWNKYLCEKDTPGIHVIAPSHVMMDGLLYMISGQSLIPRPGLGLTEQNYSNKSVAKSEQKHSDKSVVKSEENKTKDTTVRVNVERYKIGKIDKKDLIMAQRWLNKQSNDDKIDKLYMKRYAIILSYDPSLETLPKEIIDTALSYGVVIIHSNVVYKLLEKYDEYILDLDNQLKTLKNEPTGTMQIIPRFVFRTSDPMIFGITVKDKSIRVTNKVFSNSGLTEYIGRIESIQINKKDVEEATLGQEVCLKISSKKSVGKDFSNDAVLWLSG
jgi:translation initiation factor 5B